MHNLLLQGDYRGTLNSTELIQKLNQTDKEKVSHVLRILTGQPNLDVEKLIMMSDEEKMTLSQRMPSERIITLLSVGLVNPKS